ncbi:MAG: glycosyltransferase family 4 protein [Anaerolineales bacterium]|nr:glycosyltransferase family 4 protein [Anaerolineales bacterium]
MNLALFFTQGVSLKTWSTVGMLDREVALYRKLQERGIGIDFVTYGDKQDLAFAHTIPDLRIHANVDGLNLVAYERKLLSQPLKADVFKSNQMAGADIAMGAARKAGAKFIARCGYMLSEVQSNKYGPKSKHAKQAVKLEKAVFTGANAVVVTTQRIASKVSENYGVSPERINVIPNYVETDRFYPGNGSGSSKPRIGFVGRLDDEKNLFQLIKAVIDMDVEVWLIGYGPRKEQLEEFSEGGKAEFRFLGSVGNQDLPDLLRQCDLFVFPSLYEGHPKALIEAMACGLPVLGTRVQGIQEIITHEDNGLLCNTDAASIREDVQRLVDDVELRQRLARAGRAYVEEHFALERVAELEFDLLNRLVD